MSHNFSESCLLLHVSSRKTIGFIVISQSMKYGQKKDLSFDELGRVKY